MKAPLSIAALVSSLLLFPIPGAAQQEKIHQKTDPRLAARFTGGGVTWKDFHLEIARRYRGRDFAKSALNNLIETRIVGIESRKRGLRPDKLAVEARFQQIQRQLAQTKKKLSDLLKARHMTRDEFHQVVELSINTEALVRQDLGLEPGTQPDPRKIKLWMSEKKKEMGVVTDLIKLPPDVCARIKDKDIPLDRLGESMARILDPKDKKRILREMVAYRLLQRKGKELAIELKPGDIEAQLERRRRDFESRPQLAQQGLKMEDLLRAQGRTIQDLVRGEVFRTNILIQKIGDKLYPMSRIEADSVQRRDYWRDRVGPSRRVLRLWVQGPPRRTRADAEVLLGGIAKQIQSQQAFQALARKFSEDTASKQLAGDIGYLHRVQARFPIPLLAAAFDRPIGAFSPKIIEESGGFSLVYVTQEKPGPKGKELWEAIRRFQMTELLAKMIEKNHLLYHLED